MERFHTGRGPVKTHGTLRNVARMRLAVIDHKSYFDNTDSGCDHALSEKATDFKSPPKATLSCTRNGHIALRHFEKKRRRKETKELECMGD